MVGRLFQPALYMVGVLLIILGIAMAVPAAVDAFVSNPDWRVFVASACFTLAVGGGLLLGNRSRQFVLTLRQTFLVTTLSWLMLTAFAALPFAFSTLDLDYTDAFFEAMSGVTTTGSTVIVGLDGLPPGLLLWRSILQWLGGIGIIGMSIAVLPFLRVGGMQLFRTESSDTLEKAVPRSKQLVGGITVIYALMTLLAATCLSMAGMTGFEAVCHAMTAISTGGYSTSDGSIGHFDSPPIEIIIIVVMIAGSLPFALYVRAVRGETAPLLADPQVRLFLGVCAGATIALALWQSVMLNTDGSTALLQAAFNVVSIVTTTGYATTDYQLWGNFAATLILFLTFIGGCTGSTAGGIKLFRFQVLFGTVRVQILRLLKPNAILSTRFAGKPIPEGVVSSVMAFFFATIAVVTVAAFALSAFGLDPTTSLSGAVTALMNVGPGLGPIIGPAGNFAPLPDGAKWILSFAMLLGRLEIFTVLVLFVPQFWKD